jgi:hypothetical protein
VSTIGAIIRLIVRKGVSSPLASLASSCSAKTLAAAKRLMSCLRDSLHWFGATLIDEDGAGDIAVATSNDRAAINVRQQIMTIRYLAPAV